MPRAKTKIVYRNKSWFSLENVSLVKSFVVTVGPILIAIYGFIIPQIEAKAEEYVRGQFIAVGMDPETLAKIGQGLENLKGQVEAGDDARRKIEEDVGDIKGDIGKVLILLQQQQLQTAPPPVQQATPPPIPIQPQ